MAKNFNALLDKMSPSARARIEAGTKEMVRDMPLDELRAALDLTQVHLAELLRVKQSSISKLERRSDMYISTLRRIIEAMGGKLEIRAVFPAGAVRINQFRDARQRRSSQEAAQATAE
jgi:transcriptional regulator with XRE-family HTH domain